MELKLNRIFKGEYTIGKLYIDGVYFCDTLEDKVREVKIKHETAIPYGRYRVIIARSFRFQKDMPLLLDVPNFQGILIHSGNDKEDTSGCILVGGNKVKGQVINSRNTFIKLFALISSATKRNEKVYITIE